MHLNCPHCGAEIEVDPSYSKTYMQDCMSCGKEFKVQIGDEPPPLPAQPPPMPVQKPVIPEGWVCLTCEMIGKFPEKKGPDPLLGRIIKVCFAFTLVFWIGGKLFGATSVLIGSCIFILGLLLGLIQLLTTDKAEVSKCFNCGSANLIPLQSPKGHEIAKKHKFL